VAAALEIQKGQQSRAVHTARYYSLLGRDVERDVIR
jgi:hypothetical protein